MNPRVAIVAIGRNEGDRLKACLASLPDVPIVYVDSGSTDGSVELARKSGAMVVELSPDRPFTAARARREGYEALCEQGCPDFIQFIDGDCALQPGWLDQALSAMEDHLDWGIVTGWRREVYPDASVYNALCHHEWDRPAGDISTCGGDMLVRAAAIKEAGPFDDHVIAAEDDEFCVRIRIAGWTIHRLPLEMTRHDAAMYHFEQWWKRAVRSGHGFAQVGQMHPPYFARERQRVVVYGMVLPALAGLGLLFFWPLTILSLLVYGVNFLRIAQGLRGEGLETARARRLAALITLSKIPNAIGMLEFYRRRLLGRRMHIIEYK
ncbi:glycosyltransferase [Cognatishimia maritima]|uniref:Glycosyltransferase, GT2 family n=1 Tax=Cognatishimia maritima TaxID=870908 RepID=A0A1M5TTH7_9RHOB|nr:glycosyltransferase [Cognatishimia maritima]SHH54125.1 Glycosyltransferase, GT2 family [Cognatishimia maritima]